MEKTFPTRTRLVHMHFKQASLSVLRVANVLIPKHLRRTIGICYLLTKPIQYIKQTGNDHDFLAAAHGLLRLGASVVSSRVVSCPRMDINACIHMH